MVNHTETETNGSHGNLAPKHNVIPAGCYAVPSVFLCASTGLRLCNGIQEYNALLAEICFKKRITKRKYKHNVVYFKSKLRIHTPLGEHHL